MSLRFQYVMVSALIGAVPLVTLLVFTTIGNRAASIDAAEQKLATVARVRADGLHLATDAMVRDIEMLAATEALRSVAEGLSRGYAPDHAAPSAWDEAGSLLFTAQESFWGTEHHLFVVDATGRVVLSPPRPGTTDSYAGRALPLGTVRHALDGRTHMSDVFGLREADLDHPLITVPLRDAGGAVTGVLVAEVSIPALLDLLNDPASDTSSDLGITTRLYTREGVPIVRGGDERSAAETVGVGFDEIIAAGSLNTSLDDPDAGRVLARFVASDRYPWVLGVTQPASVVLAPVNQATLRYLGAGAVGLLLCLSGALVMSSRLTRPIVFFSRRLERMAQGDLTDPALHGSGTNELGELARATNHLAEMLRRIFGDVATAAQRLTGASTGLMTSSERVTGVVTEQTEEVNAISAAAAELAAASQTTTEQTAAASDAAGEVVEKIESGLRFVATTQDAMLQLDGRLHGASETIAELVELGEQIRGTVTGITEIAEQTNLLALNAAIESARAGEHGRGFAVVADEVRKLADRTALATGEVAESLTRIQDGAKRAAEEMGVSRRECEATVSASNEASAAIACLRDQAGRMRELSEAVNSVSTEQDQTCSDVAENIAHIGARFEDTQEIARSLQQNAEEIAADARSLQNLVSMLRA